jgi:flagellar motor switch protein FliN/FliY
MTTNKTENTDLRAANAAEIESLRHFLDLQAPLAIELGRTRLTVQALLELHEHSIIQLQRSTAEFVDVVASGQQIARGDIIMIEDRTGVRIHEVVTSKRSY